MTVARHPSPTKGRTMRRSDVRSAAVQPVLHDHDGRFSKGRVRCAATTTLAPRSAKRSALSRPIPLDGADDDYDQWLPFAITLGGCYPRGRGEEGRGRGGGERGG